MKLPFALLAVLFAAHLVACGDPDCPSGTTYDGLRCAPVDAGDSDAGPDGGASDGGEDAATTSDAGAMDGGTDASATDGGSDAGACPAGCDGTTPHCNTDRGECVACLTDAHCTGSTPECDEDRGICGACTPDTEESRCGAFSCNPETLECTTTERGSVHVCGGCVTDSDCASTFTLDGWVPSRCVETFFGSTPNGTYCLQEQASALPCEGALRMTRTETSVGGVTSTYCFPNGDLTSCPAMYSLGNSCTHATEVTDCGDPSRADGLCVSGACTIRCESDDDCAPYAGECITADGACSGT